MLHVLATATKILILLCRHLFTCHSPTRHRAFIALAISIPDYASTVWNPHTQKNISAQENRQNHGACRVCGSSRFYQCILKWPKSYCAELFWPSLYMHENTCHWQPYITCSINTSPYILVIIFPFLLLSLSYSLVQAVFHKLI